MAEQQPPGDGGKKPKKERKQGSYTIIGAIGTKDSKIEDLEFRVIGQIEAVNPKQAKEKILAENPNFPDGENRDLSDGESARPTDLQSLVRGERLFLEAKSGFNPRQIEIDQPPPRFKGL